MMMTDRFDRIVVNPIYKSTKVSFVLLLAATLFCVNATEVGWGAKDKKKKQNFETNLLIVTFID